MARAVIGKTPGLDHILARDWRRAARFYARFGVTEELVRHGVPAGDSEGKDLAEGARSPVEWGAEARTEGVAVFPGGEES